MPVNVGEYLGKDFQRKWDMKNEQNLARQGQERFQIEGIECPLAERERPQRLLQLVKGCG